jgi:hypothetical protein
MFYLKYVKYKNKYINLKQQLGGFVIKQNENILTISEIEEIVLLKAISMLGLSLELSQSGSFSYDIDLTKIEDKKQIISKISHLLQTTKIDIIWRKQYKLHTSTISLSIIINNTDTMIDIIQKIKNAIPGNLLWIMTHGANRFSPYDIEKLPPYTKLNLSIDTVEKIKPLDILDYFIETYPDIFLICKEKPMADRSGGSDQIFSINFKNYSDDDKQLFLQEISSIISEKNKYIININCTIKYIFYSVEHLIILSEIFDYANLTDGLNVFLNTRKKSDKEMAFIYCAYGNIFDLSPDGATRDVIKLSDDNQIKINFYNNIVNLLYMIFNLKVDDPHTDKYKSIQKLSSVNSIITFDNAIPTENEIIKILNELTPTQKKYFEKKLSDKLSFKILISDFINDKIEFRFDN